jgi:competence protein ComEC
LVCVTTAAQILTYPLVAYHFHQFPTLFLITNLIAVPLSSLLIFALIGLLAVSWWPAGATIVGRLIQWSIQYMNEFVSWVAAIPYSLIDGISFTIPQVVFLFAAIAAAGWWLLNRSARGFVFALLALAGFTLLYVLNYTKTVNQQELIVYNIPQHAAIDMVAGRQYRFMGDEELLTDGFLQNFHLKPSRVLHQMQPAPSLPNVTGAANVMQLGNIKLVIVNNRIHLFDTAFIQPQVVVLTRNPAIKLEEINAVFHPEIIVADATNKFYKINQWQQEAARLHLRFHPVSEQGAFVMKW